MNFYYLIDNLLSFSLKPIPALSAASLAQKINSQNPSPIVSAIQRWDAPTQSWQTYTVGLPFNDFPIVPGEGYFLKANGQGGWTQTGTPLASVDLKLAGGFALVGLVTTGHTAQTLAGAIDQKAGAGSTMTIQRWDASTQSWQTFAAGLPVGDFPIELNRSYFIRRNSATTVTIP
jgi:hypothetical protein